VTAGEVLSSVDGKDTTDLTVAEIAPLVKNALTTNGKVTMLFRPTGYAPWAVKATPSVTVTSDGGGRTTPSGGGRPTPSDGREVTLDQDSSQSLGIKLIPHVSGKGLAIRTVADGSQADGQINAGEVVTHINGTDVTNMSMAEMTPIFKRSRSMSLRVKAPNAAEVVTKQNTALEDKLAAQVVANTKLEAKVKSLFTAAGEQQKKEAAMIRREREATAELARKVKELAATTALHAKCTVKDHTISTRDATIADLETQLMQVRLEVRQGAKVSSNQGTPYESKGTKSSAPAPTTQRSTIRRGSVDAAQSPVKATPTNIKTRVTHPTYEGNTHAKKEKFASSAATRSSIATYLPTAADTQAKVKAHKFDFQHKDGQIQFGKALKKTRHRAKKGHADEGLPNSPEPEDNPDDPDDPAEETKSMKKKKKKSIGKRAGSFFSKIFGATTAVDDQDVRTVLRTLTFPAGGHLRSCTAGEEVIVLRSLPDNTYIIEDVNADHGTALLAGAAFIAMPPDSDDGMDDVDLNVFNQTASNFDV
jgi:hypothetical protein